MPSAKVIDTSGGSIILNLPFSNLNEIKVFTKILNKNFDDKQLKPLKNVIKECGLSFTTLEEIFLKVKIK